MALNLMNLHLKSNHIHIWVYPLVLGIRYSISTERSIFHSIKNFILNDAKLDPSKFVSCTGDNCNTNFGSNNGVMVIYFQQKVV